MFHRIPRAAYAGLFLAYAFLLYRLRGDFELTGDDGSWVRLARELLQNRYVPLYGVMSSQGIPNPAYAVYLHALFYWLVPGIGGVIAGVGCTILLTHALLVRVGNRASGWGLAASLLFFFSPAFFVFYNQKLWQVCYLPLFVAALFFCAQEYLASFRARWFVAACFFAGLCPGFHFAAALLLPAVFLLPSLAPAERRLSFPALLAGGAAVFAGSVPVFLWAAAERPWLVVPGVALCFGALVVSHAGERSRRFLVEGLPLIGLLVAWSFGHSALEGVAGLFDLLAVRGPYLAAHVGTGGWDAFFSQGLLRVFSLLALLVTVFLARCVRQWAVAPPFERFLFYTIWIPFWLLVASAAVFRDFPHQWYVFFFPGVILAAVLALRGRWRRELLAALLALSLVSDFTLIRFVESSGGVSWHLASVETKLAVLRAEFAAAPGARVFSLVQSGRAWWDYDLEGWREAAAETHPEGIAGPHRLASPAIYLFEPGAFFADSSLATRLEGAGAFRRERRGVRVYELAKPLEGVGVEL